jgi:hypothetical protein
MPLIQFGNRMVGLAIYRASPAPPILPWLNLPVYKLARLLLDFLEGLIGNAKSKSRECEIRGRCRFPAS